MPTGFRDQNGVDLEQLFVPGGGPVADFLRTSAGVPLQFLARAGAKRADVGYRTSAGVDVSNLWEAAGGSGPTIPALQGRGFAAAQQATDPSGVVSASVTLTVGNNGEWSVTGSTGAAGVVFPPPTSGTWLPSGTAPSEWEVMFSASTSGTGAQQVFNGATDYVNASSTRIFQLSLPEAPANNPAIRTAESLISLRLRRAGAGTAGVTSLSLSVQTTGFQ